MLDSDLSSAKVINVHNLLFTFPLLETVGGVTVNTELSLLWIALERAILCSKTILGYLAGGLVWDGSNATSFLIRLALMYSLENNSNLIIKIANFFKKLKRNPRKIL